MTDSRVLSGAPSTRVALRGVLEALSAKTRPEEPWNDPVRQWFLAGDSESAPAPSMAAVVLGRESLVKSLRPHYAVSWLRSPAAVSATFASGPAFVVIDETWLHSGPWGRFILSSGKPSGALKGVIEGAKREGALICVWAPDADGKGPSLFAGEDSVVYLPNLSTGSDKPRRWAVPKLVQLLQEITLADSWKDAPA